MTTKILALTDALGNLVRFVLLPGQRFDTVGVPPLIEGLAFDALIADKAFDSNAIIAELDRRGAKVVISQHPRRAKPLTIDEEMYKWRHLIENFFTSGSAMAARCTMRLDRTTHCSDWILQLARTSLQGRPRSETFRSRFSISTCAMRAPPIRIRSCLCVPTNMWRGAGTGSQPPQKN